ncbi:MAG: hypothetical protein HC930_10615 [Hydrococcus sp. SU_1_0]|nr:hypothetical protein [Hydrococcus sp. SU_1_0]
MADVSIKLGDIFLVNTPIKSHYFIAIAETSHNKYLFVTVITKKPKSELACVIKPSPQSPSFIIKESVIDYRYGREMNVKQIATAIGDNSFRECCSPEILREIQQGGIESKRLKNKYKNILKQYYS